MRLALALVVGLAGLGQFIFTVPPCSGSCVNNASNITWQHANLSNVAGYTIQVDSNTPIDVVVPGQTVPGSTAVGSQAVLGGGGIVFSYPVSSLSLSNGAHTLTICAYNSAGTSSASCPTINVTKQ